MVRIDVCDDFYNVIDANSHFNKYSKSSFEDLNLLIEYLLDELAKANDKQGQWFEKYWEVKKQLNKVKDAVKE